MVAVAIVVSGTLGALLIARSGGGDDVPPSTSTSSTTTTTSGPELPETIPSGDGDVGVALGAPRRLKTVTAESKSIDESGVYEYMDLRVGGLVIAADDVTLRFSKVTYTGDPASNVLINVGRSENFVLDAVTVDGRGNQQIGIQSNGQGYTVQRSRFTGFGDAVIGGNDLVVEHSMVEHTVGKLDWHTNAIIVDGGANGRIRFNNLAGELSDFSHSTSCLNLTADLGAIRGWLVEGNRCAGGGYAFYSVSQGFPMSDVRWIDNEVVKGTTKYGVWFAPFGPGATRVDTTYTDGTAAQ